MNDTPSIDPAAVELPATESIDITAFLQNEIR